MIQKLENGELAFGGCCINSGNIDDAIKFSQFDYDWVVIDAEHTPYNPQALETTIQFVLGRGAFNKGDLPPATVVRIPTNAREKAQWPYKQVLDVGAFAIWVPNLETVDEARAAVAAARYPRPSDAPDLIGERGVSPTKASRSWGITTTEYFDKADLWPLNPEGELMVIPLIETIKGVKNLPDILKEVKGIGAIVTGPGDLSASMGLWTQRGDSPAIEDAYQSVLATCKNAGVPAGVLDSTGSMTVEQRIDQGWQLIPSIPRLVDPYHAAGKAHERAGQ